MSDDSMTEEAHQGGEERQKPIGPLTGAYLT